MINVGNADLEGTNVLFLDGTCVEGRRVGDVEVGTVVGFPEGDNVGGIVTLAVGRRDGTKLDDGETLGGSDVGDAVGAKDLLGRVLGEIELQVGDQLGARDVFSANGTAVLGMEVGGIDGTALEVGDLLGEDDGRAEDGTAVLGI